MKLFENKSIVVIVIVAAILVVYALSTHFAGNPMEGFAKGNGRVEATDIDISAKLPGRIEAVLVNEGDFVNKGDQLAIMQLSVLDAQLNEANAGYQEAINAHASANAQVTARMSDKMAAEAVVLQRKSELAASQSRYNRIKDLVAKGAVSAQDLDDQKAQALSLEAAVATARAQVSAAEAAIEAAKAQAIGASSRIEAAKATIERVNADISDSKLVAPRDGRVQIKISQAGEVLGAGGKILNIIDLSDVYMTFFLAEQDAGRLAIDSEARLILDVAPDLVIPAKIIFVASNAQFTPKTVETENERQKLMFRVKAQINKELLLEHKEFVKTGMPGIAWVKIDPKAQWPEHLKVNIPIPTAKPTESQPTQ